MCCCFVGKFSFRSLNTFFSSHCCHCCAASILKKNLFFPKVHCWLQKHIHCRSCKVDVTADWNGPLSGTPQNWIKQMAGWRWGCHSEGPWYTTELGSQKPQRVQQWEVLCQAPGTKKPCSISVDRRPAIQAASPLKVALEVWGRS